MKSCFIKDTDQQYSIREDGEVIMHYKLTNSHNKTRIGIDKLMTKYGMNSKYITIVVNSINKSITINSLLQEYFGYKLCTQCNEIHKTKKVKCIKCLITNISNYNKSNRYKYKINKIVIDRKYRNELKNSYVASLLNVKTSILSQEIIIAKRQQVLLHRQLKTIKNENRIKSNHNNTIGHDERS
jgi:hypothetical protein